jgi:eukaryotic-like serine/threonine-protein kinase
MGDQSHDVQPDRDETFLLGSLGGEPAATQITPGTELGPFKIEALLGAGGMGQVFRARDSRLGRIVAIKILPHDRVNDPERKRRFLQEARAASALNHPNIVTLHDVANSPGIDFLVMEHVEGKSLDKLIPSKGLPLAEALDYAAQIASALAAAHGAGVAHRDIKPGNAMVTSERQVKVLDFGLAKLMERPAPGPEGETQTQESELTEAGTVMGTVAYMSPEQASARPLDHRTDIFSLGVVLYEMIAGKRPFRGASHVETMHAILHQAAPALPGRPPELQDVFDKALAKEPKERYQHAGDFALDLRRLKSGWESKSLPSMRGEPASVAKRRTEWVVALAILVLGPAAGWWAGHRSEPAATALANVTITPFTANLGYNGEPTISPDGQNVAYVSDRTGKFDIFSRQVGTTSDIQLTHDQGDNIQPAFSPDGRNIAFVSSRAGDSDISHPCCDQALVGGDLWVMPTLAGQARMIAKNGNAPSWSPDGTTIVFSRARDGIYQVAASGGEASKLPLTGEVVAVRGSFAPVYSSDGRWIFFEAGTNQGDIYAVASGGGAATRIAKGWHPAWDAASEGIVYSNSEEGRNNSLWILPFSLRDGKVSGPPRALTVGRGRDWQPSVSRDGKLIAYTAMNMTFNLETVPFDAEAGRVTGSPRALTAGNQIIYFMRFSPDGRSVVFQGIRGGGTHIWRLDVGAEPIQLTSDPRFEDTSPQWSPDGRSIAFCRGQGTAPSSLWLMAADGGNPRQVAEIGLNTARWLPDGSGVVYMGKDRQYHVYELASGKSPQITQEKGVGGQPAASPDGRWLAYQFQGIGNVDVHATPMTGGAAREIVATPRQDYHPFFSPSGRWMYFQPDHKNLYRVPGPAQDWKQTEPVKVTDFPEPAGLFLEDPQISRDGKQLLYSRGKITGDIWLLSRDK